MRKTLIVASAVAFAVGIGLLSYSSQTTGHKANHLILSNLEALSDGELYSFPCIPSPGDKCTYEALDAQGNKVKLTAHGYRNA